MFQAEGTDKASIKIIGRWRGGLFQTEGTDKASVMTIAVCVPMHGF
jgi:hypothetical protein